MKGFAKIRRSCIDTSSPLSKIVNNCFNGKNGIGTANLLSETNLKASTIMYSRHKSRTTPSKTVDVAGMSVMGRLQWASCHSQRNRTTSYHTQRNLEWHWLAASAQRPRRYSRSHTQYFAAARNTHKHISIEAKLHSLKRSVRITAHNGNSENQTCYMHFATQSMC